MKILYVRNLLDIASIGEYTTNIITLYMEVWFLDQNIETSVLCFMYKYNSNVKDKELLSQGGKRRPLLFFLGTIQLQDNEATAHKRRSKFLAFSFTL